MSAATNVTLGFKDHLTKGMTAPIHAMGRFKSSITGVVRALTSTSGLMMSFATGLGGFRLAESFIEANASLEKMTIQLNAMMGSASKGKEAMLWIKDFQLKNPIADLETLVKTFNQLVSAGINPTTGALKGMVGAMAKFNLTADNLTSITRATRQMTALTNAQKQELNQLVEQIPMLTAMVAKEMGMSQEKLLQQMEDRQIDSKAMASAMFRGLMKETDGMIEQMAGTWEATMNRLKTSWFNLMTTIGSTGIFDDIKAGIDKITEGLKKWTTQLSVFSKGMFEIGKQVMQDVVGKFTDGGIQTTLQTILQLSARFVANMRTAITVTVSGLQVAISKFLEITDIGTRVGIFDATSGDLKLESLREKREDIAKQQLKLQEGASWANMAGFGEGAEIYSKKKHELQAQNNLLKQQIDERVVMLEAQNKTAVIDFRKTVAEFKADVEATQKEGMALIEIADFWAARITKPPEKPSQQVGGVDSTRGLPYDDLIDPFAFVEPPRDARDRAKDLPNLIDMSETYKPDSFMVGMRRGLDEMTKKFDEAYGSWEKKGVAFAEITARSMGDAFDSFFFDVLEGNLRKATDYFNEFFKSIAKSIAQIVNQQIAMGIVSGIVGQFGGSMAQPVKVGNTPMTGGGQIGPLQQNGSFKASASPMQVNIINESGQPVRAKSATASQSASGMALNLVIEGLSRNENGSRDAMRAMLA